MGIDIGNIVRKMIEAHPELFGGGGKVGEARPGPDAQPEQNKGVGAGTPADNEVQQHKGGGRAYAV